jgi:hypothetical protein
MKELARPAEITSSERANPMLLRTRLAVVGAVAVLLVAINSSGVAQFNNEPIAPTGGPNLQSHLVPGEARSTLVVVDPVRQAIAVYHVDATTGEVTFKAMRNITWDLQMTKHNSDKDLAPEDVRDALPR